MQEMVRYVKLSELKRGGFGIVSICLRLTDGRRFAMKELPPSADAEAKARFRREVRMLSKLDHPNVVEVLGSSLEAEPYWYVMPLYKHSLNEKLGTMIGDEVRIAKIFTAVLDAVEYAHAQGVVHRDLKPANILMNNDWEVVVADFGIGLNTDPEASRHTSSGVCMGSMLYMAPEQRFNAKEADERSDIFALGRILDELYRGPFAGRGAEVPELPPGIAFLVQRCTEEHRGQRVQSVAELKRLYQACLIPPTDDAKLEEFKELRTWISMEPFGYSNATLDRFLVLFVDLHPQFDNLLVDTILALPPAAVAKLYGRDRASIKRLITMFCSEVARRPWPFSFTDHISDKCLGIFHAIEDPQVRGRLAACLVSLGASHNRFKVMRDAAGLIHRQKEPFESLALFEELKTVPECERQALAQYVRRSKLGETLRGLFLPL